MALSRKNHLFAGSDGSADRWVVIATLIEAAKLNRVEPYACLKDALERMSNGHTMNLHRRPSALELEALKRHRMTACEEWRLMGVEIRR